MGQVILSGFIFGICAIFMLLLGISQVRSKKPVGFYTGEKPPKAEELSDVGAWNKHHGGMWIAYGITIILSWVCNLVIGDSLWALVPFALGVLVPLPIMIGYHHYLIKLFYKGKDG